MPSLSWGQPGPRRLGLVGNVGQGFRGGAPASWLTRGERTLERVHTHLHHVAQQWQSQSQHAPLLTLSPVPSPLPHPTKQPEAEGAPQPAELASWSPSLPGSRS